MKGLEVSGNGGIFYTQPKQCRRSPVPGPRAALLAGTESHFFVSSVAVWECLGALLARHCVALDRTGPVDASPPGRRNATCYSRRWLVKCGKSLGA